MPSSVRAATEHYRADNDLAAQFLAYADIKPGTIEVSAQSLTKAYNAWRDDNDGLRRIPLHAVDRPGVIATDPVAGLLYDAGIGLPRQPEGGAV